MEKLCKDEWIWIMEYRKLIKCECDSWARAASQCLVGGTFLTLTNDLASFLLEHVGDIQHKNNGSHIILFSQSSYMTSQNAFKCWCTGTFLSMGAHDKRDKITN